MSNEIELPEPAAHMYPSDLEKFKTSETFATAFSVAVGNPDERSMPLLNLSDCVEYAHRLVAAERRRCEDLFIMVCQRAEEEQDRGDDCGRLACMVTAAVSSIDA
jgi:hypothetical protein